MKGVSINQWNEADRPREKLMMQGAGALSNAELLAILIGSGTKEESAVDLMRRILFDCNDSLNTLGKLSLDRLCAYSGIGEAKAVTLLAACELGKRRQGESPEERKKILSANDIYEYFLPMLQDSPVEECHVLLLNTALRVIGSKCIGRGGISGAVMDIRLILREVLLSRATAFAVCHNHPSGHIRPSQADNTITEKLRKAAQQMDLRFIDHLILADGAYYSYNDEGLL